VACGYRRGATGYQSTTLRTSVAHGSEAIACYTCRMASARPLRHFAVGALVLVGCATGNQVDAGQVPIPAVPDAGRVLGGDGGGFSGGGAAGNSAFENSGGTTSGGEPAMQGGSAGQSNASGGTSTDGSGGGSQAGGAAGDLGSAGNGSGGLAATGGMTASAGAGGCDATQKLCGGSCVMKTAANGCSSTNCTACAIPAPPNGLQVCNATLDCDFECLSGFQKNGNQCTSGTGSGGGSGAGGSGGNVTCGSHTCRCPGNQVACCQKINANLCFCAFQNQVSQFCQ